MDLETAMKEEINYRRRIHHLPTVQDFVTIRFRHGTIVLPEEEFNKLSKTKQRKLMKW